MRAIQVDRYGGPEVLEVAGVTDPVAGPRQVVVEVAAADVLFLDCQIRGGWGEMFGVVPPYVPGNGVAGVVVSLGDGVDRGWLGRQVVAVTAAAGPQGGYGAPQHGVPRHAGKDTAPAVMRVRAGRRFALVAASRCLLGAAGRRFRGNARGADGGGQLLHGAQARG